ncbi:WXG100 family type VII secretion target [Thermocrispum agreste]|uniref:WXG100 family type VII secretion target n=2 Tax=Thermocrispum TaxID=37924 RepID=UPI00040457BE|nr:hypothetical protein [Thermocrispum agreste]
MYESDDNRPQVPGGRSPHGAGRSTDVLGDTSTAEQLVRSAQRNRDDFMYGDDRAITNPPNWPSYSSRELYEGAVNNNDPGSAEELGALWMSQGKRLSDAADALYEAITELAGAWVGKASGAAQGALVEVANASSTAADAARTMGKRMQDQAAAAAEVKKMPPPKEFDLDRALAAGLSGGPAAMAADMKKQADEARAVQQEQQRYMNAYTKAMSEVDSTTPSFAPESIGLKPVEQSHRSTSVRGTLSGFSGAGGEATSLSSIGGEVRGMNAGQLGFAGGYSGGAGSGGSGVAGGVDVDGGHRGAATDKPVSTSGTAQITSQGNGPSAGSALGAAALGAGVGYAGAKALSRATTGGGKHSGRKPGEEPEPTLAEGAQTGVAENMEVPPQGAPPEATTQAPVLQGQPPLAKPGATAAVASGDPQLQAKGQPHPHGQPLPQQPLPQQAQAAAMAPGPVQPMGPAGAGAPVAGAAGAGAQGAEDAEHKSSYLIQPDPDDMFGPAEAVTSGVIGADFDDDDE